MLVKLLDAKNQYLLQCHPTCEVARKIWNSEYGKEECWYVLSVREDAIEAPSILLGFKEGVTREAFEREYRSGNLKAIEAMCHKISVAAGDAFFVPGGTPHALGAGCFVVEVQEPSDLTAVPIPQQALLDYRRKAAPNGIFVPEDEALYENRMLDSFVYQGSPLVHVLRRNRSSAEILRSGEWGKEISIFGREHTRLFSCTRADVLGKMPLFDTGSIQIGIVIKGSGSLESGGDMLQVRRGDELFFPFAMDPTVVSGDLSLVLCNPGNVDY
ncbi:MAG: hypothetical protein NT061_07960 [Spirochaetes bacterium]|nr:hypothetical protein [Spirochaetota bacterium]